MCNKEEKIIDMDEQPAVSVTSDNCHINIMATGKKSISVQIKEEKLLIFEMKTY